MKYFTIIKHYFTSSTEPLSINDLGSIVHSAGNVSDLPNYAECSPTEKRGEEWSNSGPGCFPLFTFPNPL